MKGNRSCYEQLFMQLEFLLLKTSLRAKTPIELIIVYNNFYLIELSCKIIKNSRWSCLRIWWCYCSCILDKGTQKHILTYWLYYCLIDTDLLMMQLQKEKHICFSLCNCIISKAYWKKKDNLIFVYKWIIVLTYLIFFIKIKSYFLNLNQTNYLKSFWLYLSFKYSTV